LEVINNRIINSLEKGIEELNEKIEAVLKTDDLLKRQSEIIQSIPGFGQVIASKLILFTEGFSKINTARKLACYAGVTPFEYRSGTSIKGKTRVSHIANKNLNKMLHLGALVTIRKGHIMYGYYQ
jgi:transposase